MNLFTGINYQKLIKKIMYLLTLLSLTNNYISLGSDNKSNFFNSVQEDIDFKEIQSLYSIPFDKYDNLDNQLRTFFGFYSVESERSYFQDLSIINQSHSIRTLYQNKLNDMTINKKNNIIKR